MPPSQTSVILIQFTGCIHTPTVLECAGLRATDSWHRAGECCVGARVVDPFRVAEVDLNSQIMAAVDRAPQSPPPGVVVSPSAAPAFREHGAGPEVQPCSAAGEAAGRSVREVDICGDVPIIEDGEGILRSPIGPYPPSASCSVRLSGYLGGQYLIRFDNFDTESDVDYLTVYDGANADAPLLGQFSGTQLPPTLASTGAELTVVFTSNDNTQSSGFSATFAFAGEPVEGWEPRDVATRLEVGTTMSGLIPSELRTACLDGVLLSVQCCADAETDCANARKKTRDML